MRHSIMVGLVVVVGGCTVSEEGAATFGPAGPMGSASAAGTDDGADESGSEGTAGDEGTADAAADGDDETPTSSADGEDSAETAAPAACGDDLVDEGEICDGSDLAGDSCEAHGYSGGVLACAADCASVDLAGCTMEGGCGNGMLDMGEQCDGANLGGSNCASLGFDMGVVSCTATCTFDTSGCADVACVEMFGDCSSMPCCAGLICYPIEGNYCGPMP